VCGLGTVGDSLVFGLVRGAGAFAAVLPSFVSVSNMSFAQHNRGFSTSFSAASSWRRETMVDGALARVSAFRVGLGVGEAVIAPGLRACPSRRVGVWFGCGGRLLGIWVGTWGRGFHCGVSIFCFSFK
jgi:hypothetical protein